MKTSVGSLENTVGDDVTFNIEQADPSKFVLMCINNTEGDPAAVYSVFLGLGQAQFGAYIDPDREVLYTGTYNAGQVYRIPAAPQITVTIVNTSAESGCGHSITIFE